ncbi:acyl transferase/acyl hydrolase/lysophospholipase [Nemania sp. NC0429]|nr:acyl transferase/acyl hydrolase/lysophospholipase [Nemania sp. NC0429]
MTHEMNAAAAAPAPAPAPPLRILSLDGGGIRGKSSLLILENIMETIRDSEGLKHTPRPCEYFDLIGGTSTGGIIAIMLGRLRMTVDECIRAYDKLGQAAFTPKRTSIFPASPSGAYSARALESAIKQTIREFCQELACVDKRNRGDSTVDSCPHEDAEFRDPSCTKTVVLAITKVNVDALPTLFTTYDASESYERCTIWQIARATSAATTFFKSIALGRDSVEFIDAGFGHNNPCEVLIEEAERQSPAHGGLRVLSIGTGLGNVATINGRRDILRALKKMATTSTLVAEKLNRRYAASGHYHRFNVDSGLQDIILSDWEKSSTISGHTKNYLEHNKTAIQTFVDSFITRSQKQQETRSEPDATVSSSVRHYITLPRNKHFVGRTETLRLLNEKLFTQDGHQRACAEVVKHLAIPVAKDEDPKKVLQQYLNSDQAGKWLLVIDNIDEMTTLLGSSDELGGIHPFLPDSDNGRILFTTRSYDIASRVAGDDTVELKTMSPEEAMRYLDGKMQLDCHDNAVAVELLDQLAHLPLAITQAVAFLKRNRISIQEYLGLLRRTESDSTELISWEFYDKDRYEKSQNAVALTWQVSFTQICNIDATAAELLRFISRIEPKAIPRSMLPTKGSKTQLIASIGTLLGYAFLDVREGGKAYDMHSLVHLATRAWVKKEGEETRTKSDAFVHLYKIFPTTDWSNRYLWREYLPHALRLLHDNSDASKESAILGYCVGSCLHQDQRHDIAVRILEDAVATWKTMLAKDDPDLLLAQHTLAGAYRDNLQAPEAVELLQHVLSIKTRTLAEDHPDRLMSQDALARAYKANDQVQEALELQKYVVSIQRTTLSETDPIQLASQHSLALSLTANGQVEEAIDLLQRIVSIRAKTLSETHPDRLASQQQLALSYLWNGQVNHAVEMLEYVVFLESTTVSETYPTRLKSLHALAVAYVENEQIQQAIELLTHVVSARETTLREADPRRLGAQYALAVAYYSNGQLREGIQLMEHVASISRTSLAEDHKDRVHCEHVLADMLEGIKEVEEIEEAEPAASTQNATIPKDHSTS